MNPTTENKPKPSHIAIRSSLEDNSDVIEAYDSATGNFLFKFKNPIKLEHNNTELSSTKNDPSGCDWCECREAIKLFEIWQTEGYWNGNTEGRLYIYNEKLCAYDDDLERTLFNVSIKYCPNCGRRLEVAE